MKLNRNGFARFAVAITLVLALAAAACGSSSDESAAPEETSAAADAPATSDEPDAPATSDEPDAPATSDDTMASESADCALNEESRTIGFAAITLQSPAVGVMVDTAQRAADLLGWELKVLNADGDPAEMAAIMAAFANQGVDAILNVAISPAQAQQGMQSAKEQDIPIIGIGGPITDPQGLIAATYAPSDEAMSVLLAEQMVKDLGDGGQALALNATGIPALEIRREVLIRETAGSGIEVAVDHETDMSNPVQDTQTAVANTLRAEPDINLIWAVQDFEFLASLQTIKNQELGDVSVYSYYPPPEALEVLRTWDNENAHVAVADSPISYVPWYAFDALINNFVCEKADWVTDTSIKELPVALMTPDNVPAGDSYEWEEFEPFFVGRWTEAGLTLNN